MIFKKKKNSDNTLFNGKEFWGEIAEQAAKAFGIISVASILTLLVVVYKYVTAFSGKILIIVLSMLSIFILYWIFLLAIFKFRKNTLKKHYNYYGLIAVIIGSIFISYVSAMDKGFMSQFYLGIIQLEIASVAYILFKPHFMILNLSCINLSFFLFSSFIPSTFDFAGFLSRAIASTVFLIISVTIYILNYIYKKRDFIARKVLKQSEENLLLAKNSMEKANNAKSDFLARMSHELRTPLTSILGFSEILKSEITNREHSNYLQIMQNSGKNLLHIIDDILDMSKIEAGEIDIRPGAFDIKQLLEDIKQIFTFESESKGIPIHYNTPFYNKLIIMDSQRLSQIIINLVGNALKYTEEGEIRLTSQIIDLPNHPDTADIEIKISDTGRGIPQEYIGKIFNPFFQIADIQNRRKSGVGLGLAITKLLVERMNGEISVKSEKNSGTEFIIRFPSIPVTDDKYQEQNQFDSRANQFLNGKTVLIVEDIAEIREIIKKYLIVYNMYFTDAENGNQALEYLKISQPDIIIMDIKMPEKGGMETLKEIRGALGLNNVSILAVSASVFYEERKDILIAGADGFVPKPINQRELIIELINCLEKKNSG